MNSAPSSSAWPICPASRSAARPASKRSNASSRRSTTRARRRADAAVRVARESTRSWLGAIAALRRVSPSSTVALVEKLQSARAQHDAGARRRWRSTPARIRRRRTSPRRPPDSSRRCASRGADILTSARQAGALYTWLQDLIEPPRAGRRSRSARRRRSGCATISSAAVDRRRGRRRRRSAKAPRAKRRRARPECQDAGLGQVAKGRSGQALSARGDCASCSSRARRSSPPKASGERRAARACI